MLIKEVYMKSNSIIGALVSLVFFLLAPVSNAQNHDGSVYWHIDPNIKTCSMIIDPSLTQDQWHKFVREGSAILSFKSLASAKTLGTLNFSIAIDQGTTPVDQHSYAWINTFAHPDADCPLGDAIVFPAIRAGMGLTDNIDIGAYWTSAPGANYGGVGAEVKYALLQDSENLPAAATRASVSILTGVPDFNINIYSLEMMASKEFSLFTPYLGLRMNLATGAETTSKVNLERENILFPQGYAGVNIPVWMFRLAAEYNVSSVNTLAVAVGVNL
jgi:hypothetical protein